MNLTLAAKDTISIPRGLGRKPIASLCAQEEVRESDDALNSLAVHLRHQTYFDEPLSAWGHLETGKWMDRSRKN